MALPVVRTLADCVDLHRTVLPYSSQLYDLPQQTIQTISNAQGLKVLYVSTNPLISAFAFSLVLFPIFLVVSEINKNYSQVDRCWSILPTIYNAHYALYAHAVGLPTHRLDALLAVSTAWSCRLTYNYWRKGGYEIGSEDYRWETVRKYAGQPWFFIFNIVFISLAQSVLLFLVTTPSYVLLLSTRLARNSLMPSDQGFAALMLALVAVSAAADQQQWNYQTAKKLYQNSAKVPTGYQRDDLDRGFITSGLWAYSRHPNFAAEQSVWVSLYIWACQTTETYYNWTIIGPFAYLCLFQASTWFTELITSRKYPEYSEYQRQVGMFVPGLGARWTGPSRKKISKTEEKKRK